MTFRFGSVCSGIEAASVAFAPLGWQAAWLAEIEPFPSAVLAHHYPDVPNLGDMTTIADRIRAGLVEAPDMLCGGTPCQAFSVAGQRRSLSDERGNLSLVFCELADAIDDQRFFDGLEPCIVFWENVPGCLNTNDNAFGCILGELAGEDCALEPPGGKWADAGAVFGPKRAIAWRVLDAQYFGVAQRRRRVFLVASARKGFDPAAVLFEFDGVRRDSAPRREPGKVAPTIPSRSTAGGGLGTDFDLDGGVITMAHGQGGAEIGFDRGPMLTCNHEAPICVHGTQDPCTSSTTAFALGRNNGGENVVCVTGKDYGGDATAELSPTLRAMGHAGSHANGGGQVAVGYAIQAGALRTNPASGPDGVGVQSDHAYTLEARAEVQAVAHVQVCPTLRAGGNNTGGDRPPGTDADTADSLLTVPVSATGDVFHTLRAEGFDASEDGTGRGAGVAVAQPVAEYYSHDYCQDRIYSSEAVAPALNCTQEHKFRAGMAVRRLTPRECERLQGFPDDYTAIPWKRKPASECPDGPRYKALGNSWAVPCVRWVGRRIVAELHKDDDL